MLARIDGLQNNETAGHCNSVGKSYSSLIIMLTICCYQGGGTHVCCVQKMLSLYCIDLIIADFSQIFLL